MGAEITGWGMGYDPSRGARDERAQKAVGRAIRHALSDAELEPGAIGAVSASANGSVVGDRSEARGIAGALGGGVPVTAVKSMLGECLGASGAFQTVALLQAMESGVLPGIHGLEEPEGGLPSAGLSAANREVSIGRGLVTAVGLDGNTCALVVGSPTETA